jgi:hypothetical protein
MAFLRKILLILAIGFVVSLAAAQMASYFLLKPILEREVRRMFQVPVYIEKAGANLFGGSVWMKNVRVKNGAGFKERDILSARTVAVDLNILSLLTHEFSIRRILFKDPQLMLEVNEQGEFNGSAFFDRILDRSEKLVHSERKFVHLVTKYILEKFSIRNGAIKFIDHRSPTRNLSLEFISFSLARLVYPPDPEEALPVAIYMNATIPGDSVGKIIVLGRVNPFASKKSFDITGSIKNLPLTQYKNFMVHSPLPVTEGTLQLKIKALCHENQVDIYHQVRLDQLRFSPEELPQGEAPLVFGLKSDSIVNFFNNRGAPAEAFEFDFRVAGDFGDPNFDLFSTVGDQMQQAVRNRLTAQMKAVSEKAVQVAG